MHDGICPTGWIRTDEILGTGAGGNVYRTCCGCDCDYVTKVPTSIGNRPRFQAEVANSLRCAQLGLCPQIYQVNDEEQTIIMDALDMTFGKIFKIYKDPDVQEEITNTIFELLDRLHKNGIIHADLHFGNIMVKAMNRGLRDTNPSNAGEKARYGSEKEYYDAHNYRYYFIDISNDVDIPPSMTIMIDVDYNGLYMEYLDNPDITLDYRQAFRNRLNPFFHLDLIDPNTGISNLMIYVANDPGLLLKVLTGNMSPKLLDHQDNQGDTALMYAVHSQSPYAYEVLILNGANPELRNRCGAMASDYIADSEKWEKEKRMMREEINY